MAESRLQRWSRKKAAARKPDAPDPPSALESSASPTEQESVMQELGVNESLPEHELLAKYHLPAPDAIELGTDIKGFLRQEIPELLRRKALRALWKSNPVLAVRDGLNDYDEDFSDAATAGKAIQTLYQVGQGFIDKTARLDKPVENDLEGPAGPAASPVAPSIQPPVAPSVQPPVTTPAPVMTTARLETAGAGTDRSEPGIDVDYPANIPPFEAVASRAEGKTAPRYRPRMRFD